MKKSINKTIEVPALAKVFRTNDCENKIYWYENKRLLICKKQRNIID